MDDAVVRLYGSEKSPQAYAIRDYLQRSDIPFEWVELKDNQQARAELGLASVDDARLPICIPDGTEWSGQPCGRSPRSSAGSAIRLARNTTLRSMGPVPQA